MGGEHNTNKKGGDVIPKRWRYLLFLGMIDRYFL
jgi:hypothetical protein